MCKKLFCLVSQNLIKKNNLVEGKIFNESRGGCQPLLEKLLSKVPKTSKDIIKERYRIVEIQVEEQQMILQKESIAIKQNSNAIIIKISNWN